MDARKPMVVTRQGWASRELKRVAREVQTWPRWMVAAAKAGVRK